MKVKAISLPYIFEVMYVLCFTRPRYQVSVYRTIGPLVLFIYFFTGLDMVHLIVQHVMFLSANLSSVFTVKPVFSDHIKQDIFLAFQTCR